jgi:5-methylcytosine-specific restriction endonuclease McrA
MSYRRHSTAVIKSRRWRALRLETLRRDGFRCVGILPDGSMCGARGRLEVDHVKPVRTHPELAYELSNLQALCVPCHSRKTRIEVGMGAADPRRDAWRELVGALSPSRKEATCSSQ